MHLGGDPTVEVRLRPPVTLDQLIVLDAVAREGSFAAAAQVLHRVPSAVSYAIKGLEDALGVSLFDRTGRIAVLTPAGRRLLGEAREVQRQRGGRLGLKDHGRQVLLVVLVAVGDHLGFG